MSDAFIALPGGFATLEEFFEVLTWAQLGLHQKLLGLLNVDGYYDSLLNLLAQTVTEQLVNHSNRFLILESSNLEHLLKLFANYQPQKVDKWIRQNV